MGLMNRSHFSSRLLPYTVTTAGKERGSEWGGPLVGCRLKFSYFVGSRLKFSIFVGCRLILVNK